MKIAVYGNAIYDHVLQIEGKFSTEQSNVCKQDYYIAGGLVNFCRAASNHADLVAVADVGDDEAGIVIRRALNSYGVKANLSLPQQQRPTTTATIICDSNSRTGIVKWGACRHRQNWELVDADWHHFMYLDKLDIDIRKLNVAGIISADITDGGLPQVYDQIASLDYLFASAPSHAIIPAPRIGLFLHGPNYHYVKDKSGQYEFQFESVPGLNVLGAGDYLAAFAVLDLFSAKRPDLERIHQQTLDLLQRQTCEPTLFCL
jgi:hypothetical protein